MDIWHRRLAHAGLNVLKKLPSNSDGVVITTDVLEDKHGGSLCTECHIARPSTQISRAPQWVGDRAFDKIHVDVIHFNEAYDKRRYVFHAYCSYSGYHFAASVFTKDTKTLYNALTDMVIKMNHWGYRVRVIRMDGDSAFQVEQFKQAAAKGGITIETSPPATPEQNGHAERSGGVLTEKARRLGIESGMPENLWPEFIDHAVQILNRTPVAQRHWKTPHEIVHGRKPNLAGLRVLGSKAYVTNRKLGQKDKKTGQRSEIGFYMGFKGSNIIKLWMPDKRTALITSRDVIVDENVRYSPDLARELVKIQQRNEVVELLETTIPPPIQNDEDVHVPDNDIAHVVPTPQGAEGSNASASDHHGQAENTKSGHAGSINNPYPTPTPEPEDSVAVSTEHDMRPDDTEAEVTAPHAAPHVDPHVAPPVAPSMPAIPVTPPVAPPVPATPAAKRTRIRKATENDVVRNLRSTTRGNVGRNQAHSTLLETADDLTPFHHAFTSTLQKQVADLDDPPQYWQALRHHPEKDGFYQAAKDEIQLLKQRGTFSIVPIPKGKQIIPLKWVFTYKGDANGNLIKHKARICVRGDLQIAVLPDISAATGHFRTLRILFAIAAAFDLEILQMDAILAFINAQLDEEVYVKNPPGFDDDKNLCWRLHRALYGLKRSPKLWQQEIASTLHEFGMTQSTEDQALFIHPSEPIYTFVYVDDFLLMAPRILSDKLYALRDRLKQRYNFRDLGKAESFLGLRIIRDRGTQRLWISQDQYIERKLHEFNLETYVNTKIKTPLSTTSLTPNELQATKENILEYQRKAGSLIYPAVIARPDVAFAASQLCLFMTNPSQIHQNELNRALVYLYNTRHLSLCYSNDQASLTAASYDPSIFAAASDASFADNPDRKSSQGFVINLFNGPIAWQATKQKTVTTSTTEAELLALSHVGREIQATLRLFNDLRLDTDIPTTIACDNKQTVRLLNCETPQLTTKLRHVDIHHFWLRQETQSDHFIVQWVPTDEMPADGLTKALSLDGHRRFIKMLGMEIPEY
jgi:hypothetical protein